MLGEFGCVGSAVNSEEGWNSGIVVVSYIVILQAGPSGDRGARINSGSRSFATGSESEVVHEWSSLIAVEVWVADDNIARNVVSVVVIDVSAPAVDGDARAVHHPHRLLHAVLVGILGDHVRGNLREQKAENCRQKEETKHSGREREKKRQERRKVGE